MIIVVGSPVVGPDTLRPGRRAAGLAVGIALAARHAGARVELVGKVGDDAEGDALAVELERDGVGHAALLRDPAAATPHTTRGGFGLPATLEDVELALRYLTEAKVLVAVAQQEPSVAAAIADAASYAGAHLIVVEDRAAASGGPAAGGPEAADRPRTPVTAPDATGAAVTRLAAPRDDDGPFASLVGDYAAALDRGDAPDVAFGHAVAAVGWEPAHG